MRTCIASRHVLFCALVALAVTGLTAVVSAEVPQVINYQGRLLDDTGSPAIDNDYQITFSIWSSETGGTQIWSSGSRTVNVKDGLFSYVLGSVMPLPAGMFTDTTRWLGISVNGEPEMDPRTRLVTVPYAYHALRADTANHLVSGAAGDITAVYAGDGLSGGGEAGDVTVDVSFSGNGTAGTVARSDHNHDGIYVNEGQANSVNGYMIQDATIGFEDMARNDAMTGQVMKWNGSAWAIANDSVGGGETITSYLSVPAAAFTPRSHYVLYGKDMMIATDDATTWSVFCAPVHLPHGATVTAMKFYWRDENPTYDGYVTLWRNNLDNTGWVIAADTTSGSAGNGISLDDEMGYWNEIDNSSVGYHLRLVLRPDIGCYAVIIEYTLTE